MISTNKNASTLLKIVVIAGLAASVSTGVARGEVMSEQKIKELALKAILEHPQIVLDAVELIKKEQRARQQDEFEKQSALDLAKKMEGDPNAPSEGAAGANVTVIQFFDYNCSICRKVEPNLEALLQADPKIRIVYREWPIFGPGSIFAARASLASQKQGQYGKFHRMLMAINSPVDETSVIQVAREIGLDVDKLREDMNSAAIDEHINNSGSIANLMGFAGTPSFVIGGQPFSGGPDMVTLRGMVTKARTGAVSK